MEIIRVIILLRTLISASLVVGNYLKLKLETVNIKTFTDEIKANETLLNAEEREKSGKTLSSF